MAVDVKMCSMVKVKFMKATVKEWNNKETGRGGLSYQLVLEIGDEFVNMPCTKEVYDFMKDVEREKEISIIGNYSVNYKNFRVTDVKVLN